MDRRTRDERIAIGDRARCRERCQRGFAHGGIAIGQLRATVDHALADECARRDRARRVVRIGEPGVDAVPHARPCGGVDLQRARGVWRIGEREQRRERMPLVELERDRVEISVRR